MKNFFGRHGIWILTATAVLALGLCALSYFSDTSSLFHDAVGIAASPFRAAAQAVTAWVEDKQRYYRSFNELLEENRALREEVAELRADARQAEKDRTENALLRELLGLRERRRDLVFESAKVLERGVSNWSSTMTLNRGTSHGVAVKNVVVSSEGYLIGVVTEAGTNWCTVRTIVDPDTELGALLYRTGDVVIAEGELALMTENRLRAVYLPEDATLLIGDYVVTSGLGGYYPSDLVIGTVERVETDDNGFAQYAVLAPMAKYEELTEVFIIKDFEIVE
jgi:rod shape-determining protein MreC